MQKLVLSSTLDALDEFALGEARAEEGKLRLRQGNCPHEAIVYPMPLETRREQLVRSGSSGRISAFVSCAWPQNNSF